MGRGKINFEYIQNERDRKSSFMQRKDGLIKKMSTFSEIFGVEACLIVYEGNGDSQPMIWPQDPSKVLSLIEKYKLQKNERHPKSFDLEDFFMIKKTMAEAQISKVRKETLQIKYPTSDPILNRLDEEHVMSFITMLDTKIAACKQRIDMLKSNQHGGSNFNFGMNMAQSEAAAFASNPSQLNFMQNISQTQFIPTPMTPLNHNYQLAPYMLDHDVASQSPMLPLVPQMPHFNNGVMGSTRSQVDVPLDCTKQNGVIVDSANQIGELMAFTNQVDVPPDCTKQNGVIGNSTNQLDELVDWTKFGEFENWTNQPSEFLDWNYQPVGEMLERTNQPAEQVNWTNKLNEPDLQVIPSQPQNVPQSLHILPPTVDEFLTDEYNNVHQVQLFNHLYMK